MKNKTIIILVGVVLFAVILLSIFKKKKGNQIKFETNNSNSSSQSDEIEPKEVVSKSTNLDDIEKELLDTTILEEDFSDL